MKCHERPPHLTHARSICVIDRLAARGQVGLKEDSAAKNKFVAPSTQSSIYALENMTSVPLQGRLVNTCVRDMRMSDWHVL